MEGLGATVCERFIGSSTWVLMRRAGLAGRVFGVCECARSAGYRGRNCRRELLVLRSIRQA